MSALSVAEARGRAASVMAAVLMLGALAPFGFETRWGEPLAEGMLDRAGGWLALSLAVAATLLVVFRSTRRSIPAGKDQVVLTAVATVVLGMLAVVVVILAIEEGRRLDDEPAFWAMGVMPVVGALVLGRATRMEGWSAWAHKLASVLISFSAVVLLAIAMDEWQDVADCFVFFVAVAAAAPPLVLFILFGVRETAGLDA